MSIKNVAHVGMGKISLAMALSSIGSFACANTAIYEAKENEEEQMRLKAKNEIPDHEFRMRPNPIFFDDYPDLSTFERPHTKSKKNPKNQRQKRKFNRQNPHSKKYRK